MKVKQKITLILALPVCGLAAFILFSVFQMRGVSTGMRTASGETFIPILKTNIPEMNRLSIAISKLLNADRDAYQANVAELVAINTENPKELQKADQDNRENIAQVKQRVDESAVVFDDQMKPIYEKFNMNFRVWEKQSRQIIALSKEKQEQHKAIMDDAVEGDKLFTAMRGILNQISDSIAKDLDKDNANLSIRELDKGHKTLALLLNADRDIYQAFLAQTQALTETSPQKMAALDKDNADNIQQVEQRFGQVASSLPYAQKPLAEKFQQLFAEWKTKSRKAIAASHAELQLVKKHQEATVLAQSAFSAMRGNIDDLGNVMEEKIKVLAGQMDKQGLQATGELDIMAGNMSSAVLLFVIVGVIMIVIPLVLGTVCIRKIISPLERAVGVAKAVSDGDFSQRLNIASNDEIGILARAIDRIPETLEKIETQFDGLSVAAENGDLSFRGEAGQFSGAYRQIIEIVNKTLDNISCPVNDALRVLERMQVNDLTNKVEYHGLKGDYLKVAQSVNNVRGRLERIQDTVQHISEGNLQDLEEYEKIGGRSPQDKLIPAFIQMMRNLQALIADIEAMAVAGQDGKLNTRAEEGKHSGAFRNIVAGVNKLMSSIAVPLEEVGGVMGAVADGDLTRRVNGSYRGDFGQLKNNINTTVESIDSAIRQVSEAVSQVNSGSVQISDASQSLSQGATEQAASLEEISSSLNEISSQVTANAGNASKSNDLSRNASANAEAGFQEMKSMVDAMNDINESSQQIAKIIKIIDEIAFQTNLLALNAAVEAARAGVHGKGFAVVAEEVRNLAGRSAKAAKETAEMIETSLTKVEHGRNIVNNSAQSFEKIVSNIAEVSEIGGGIAEACNQQAEGLAQINVGLTQIDQVTQQNTAHAEETAAAAEQLAGQSTHLHSLINHFRVTS